jgi:hypothetical protein
MYICLCCHSWFGICDHNIISSSCWILFYCVRYDLLSYCLSVFLFYFVSCTCWVYILLLSFCFISFQDLKRRLFISIFVFGSYRLLTNIFSWRQFSFTISIKLLLGNTGHLYTILEQIPIIFYTASDCQNLSISVRNSC